VALAAAAIFDWSRPSVDQVSVRLFLSAAISPYRSVVRPVTSKFIRCRFTPTCSAYATQAVLIHGFPRGMWLTCRRIIRCGPWTPMGTNDPVPLRN
jgi:hypothetical protein